MAETPQNNRSNALVARYAFTTKPPRQNDSFITSAQASPARDLYRPAPLNLVRPEPEPAAESGFYIVPRSMSAYDFYHGLFENMPDGAFSKYAALNPSVEDIVKAGTLIVLGDPRNTSCTYAESQMMQAAQQVKAALAPLTPEEADFMYQHGAEIIGFTGQTSTWLGVSAAVMEAHLNKMTKTLQAIEKLHQDSFRQHGHLRSPEFFAKRKQLLAQLDDHLLNSTRLRGLTTFNDHFKLKNALGISSRSLIHQWKEAGGPGQITGYVTHVNSISRAAKYMKAGGYIGIGIGGVSSVLAVQDVCRGKDAEACRKIRFTEGGKFALSTAGGIVGGQTGYLAAPVVCAALGVSTGVGGVLCASVLVGTGSWAGTTGGGVVGEWVGEFIYESSQP